MIKTREFPTVVKNLGFTTTPKTELVEDFEKLKDYEKLKDFDKIKIAIPILQLKENTFKTLPSIRHSNFPSYRQSSVSNEANKTDSIDL